MASERFLTVQSAIQASAEPIWERWTIDEVDEDVVRVLVSRSTRPEELSDIAGDVAPVNADAPSDRVMRDRLHSHAMRVELDSAAYRWSRERAMFIAKPVLEPFLRARGGKPGLPTNRPLREGDVFWVLLPGGAAMDLPPERGATVTAGAERVAEYRARHADVWDVTAAARQV